MLLCAGLSLGGCKPDKPDALQYRVGNRGQQEAEEAERAEQEQAVLGYVADHPVTAAEIAQFLEGLPAHSRYYYSLPTHALRLLMNYGLILAMAYEGVREGLSNDPYVRLAWESALMEEYQTAWLSARTSAMDLSERTVQAYADAHKEILLDELLAKEEISLEEVSHYLMTRRTDVVRELIELHPVTELEIDDELQRDRTDFEKLARRASLAAQGPPPEPTPGSLDSISVSEEEVRQAARNWLEEKLQREISELAVRERARWRMRQERKESVPPSHLLTAARERMVAEVREKIWADHVREWEQRGGQK
jgi:hypothetical protein